MAESFKSFNTSINVNQEEPQIIIGIGNESNMSNTRPINNVAQIHSIYISQVSPTKIPGIDRYNPANFSAFNLYIQTGSSGEKIYIVYDGRVVPGAPFFIEKNITLEVGQKLVIECPQDSTEYDQKTKNTVTLNSGKNYQLHISASAVLFPVVG